MNATPLFYSRTHQKSCLQLPAFLNSYGGGEQTQIPRSQQQFYLITRHSCLKKTFSSVKTQDSPPLPELGPVAHYSLQHSLILLISCGEGLRPQTSVTQDLGFDECHIGLYSVHSTSNAERLEISQMRASCIFRRYSLNGNEL